MKRKEGQKSVRLFRYNKRNESEKEIEVSLLLSLFIIGMRAGRP